MINKIDKDKFFADTHTDRTIITRLIDIINVLIDKLNQLESLQDDRK